MKFPISAPSNHSFVARSKIFSRVASAFVSLVGALVLTGWLLNIHRLKSVYADITMKANTALALLLTGASLWLLNSNAVERTLARRVAQVCAALVALIGALTLSEHIFGWNPGIDQLLFKEPPGALATTSPGRMGPNAATCLTLSGVAVLMFTARRFVSLAQLLSIIVGLLALLAIIGYAYQAEALYGIASYTGIAVHTAMTFFTLSLGLLAARSGEGMISVVSSNRAGGLMARRLLFTALAVPFLLGWLRVLGQRAGYYDLGFGAALLVLAIIIIFTTAIWRSAAKLDYVEQQRLDAEASEQAAQARLRDILVRISDGFIAFDGDWRYVYLNEKGAQMLQKSRDELLGKIVWEVFPDVVGSESFVRLHRALEEQTPAHFEYLSAHFKRWYEMHAYPSPQGVSLFYRDITERKSVEDERERLLTREQASRVQAEAASRLKDEFLATVSHELRTPLSAILGWSTMLRSHELDDDTSERAMETIERNAKAQAQLIEDLLDVSRIISGKLRLEVKDTDLISVINGAIDSVRPAAVAKEIRVQMVLDPAASHIQGDASRLQQVVWNLLSNAVKFTSKGGRVQVTLERAESKAQLTVSDTGDGISPAFLPYVFDRFQQADGSITRRHGGLGLGLAIARHLVEMHGGDIAAESGGEGQGAAFTVRLPIQAVRAARASSTGEAGLASHAAAENSNRQETKTLQGLRILAVDDEADTREMLKGVLEYYGADVMTVASAADALDAVPGWKPHMLVCDIGMPHEDGYTLIRKVRGLEAERGGQTPAIALTGYVRVEERVRALEAGYQMFVPKPVEADELTAIIASLVERTDEEA